jgi:hypothetical protein
MNPSLSVVRAIVKTVVDCCVLPGTALGAEIFWLYARQWKSQFSMYSLALISLLYSFALHSAEAIPSWHSFTGQENTR